jgi:hypothetical protein
MTAASSSNKNGLLGTPGAAHLQAGRTITGAAGIGSTLAFCVVGMDTQDIGILVALPEAVRDDPASLVLERRVALIEEKDDVLPAVPGLVIPDL